MKKTAFSIFLTFIFLSMFYQLNTFAEDTTQWRLPEGAKARLGKGNINEMAYSPNGTHLAVAGSIGIWLYDMTTYQEVALLTGPVGHTNSVAFSPDGSTIVSGSQDGKVYLWDTNTLARSQTLTTNVEWVSSVAFSPDGNTIAISGDNEPSRDEAVRLWDAHTGELLKTLTEYIHSVTSVVFSADGNTYYRRWMDGR